MCCSSIALALSAAGKLDDKRIEQRLQAKVMRELRERTVLPLSFSCDLMYRVVWNKSRGSLTAKQHSRAPQHGRSSTSPQWQ
jgi:hypothetical protein